MLRGTTDIAGGMMLSEKQRKSHFLIFGSQTKRWKALESYRHPGGWKHISDDPRERNPGVRVLVILLAKADSRVFLFIPLLHTDALD